MYTIFTDTDCDFTHSDVTEYGIKLISMPYSIDGKTIYPYEDFREFDAHSFYETLRNGVVPTTSAIPKERYLNYFEPEFQNGRDILYLHFSSAMSATFASMKEAVEDLKQRYPERSFYSADTGGISILSRNIVKEALALCAAGREPWEIAEWVEKEKNHFAVYFFADDLRFFRRSGRVSGLAATMGTVLGVRPIIYVNDEGRMISIGKERGKANATERLLHTVEELGKDLSKHRILIGHTDAPETAEELCAALTERYGKELQIECIAVNPTIGSHCGPSTVGICFYAKHR